MITDRLDRFLRNEFHLDTTRTKLQAMARRMAELEAEVAAQREYIAYDAEWHFRDMLADIEHGTRVEDHLPRLTWQQFLEKYNAGWRPSATTEKNSAPATAPDE